MLERVALEHVGPASRMELTFAPRLNLLTGDNGVGKTFLLDVVAWAFAGRWINQPPLPHRGGGKPQLLYQFQGHPPSLATYFPKKEEWWRESSQRQAPLVLYARANGAFLVSDPFRLENKAPVGSEFDGQVSSLFLIDERGLLQGVVGKNGVLLTNGLLRDWSTWQFQYPEAFQKFQAALLALSTHPEELRIGKPVRLSTRDAADTPTLGLPYGEIPITHLSSGMRRIMGLAYMLVWAWFEHRKAAEVLQQPPLRELALVIDEVEAHLHPRWQRSILPSLLAVVRGLMPELRVQLFVSTHAPLVASSLEAHFDDEHDALFEFELTGNEVQVERAVFRRLGEVGRWLTSEVFDLPSTRSREGEQTLARVNDAMLDPAFDRSRALELDMELRAILGDTDPFWPTWRFFLKKKGWDA
jgi:hypothetical protein